MKEFQNNLTHIPKDSKLLLAVSGGMDSMVMLHLFSQSDFEIVVAHCNFQLRGEDSDEDEKLVTESCATRGLKCVTKNFNLAKEHPKKGTQESARIARYQWFEELRSIHELDLVVTAHHENDQAETLIFNFLRGSGISGLSGMQVLEGHLFRPLLDSSSAEIEHFQKENNITFREDSSNSSLKYTRNKIRHQLLPILGEFNPNIVSTLTRQAGIFKEAEQFLANAVDKEIAACTKLEDKEVWISIEKLKDSELTLHILHQILAPKGFTNHQIRSAEHLASGQTGKVISADHWQVQRDHDHLVLHEIQNKNVEPLYFHNLEDLKYGPLEAAIKPISDIDFKDESHAWLDSDLVEYPLILRSWKEGDRFQPFGMKGHQKISDFLTHEKVSAIHKKEQLVLCQGEQIIWVVGKRIDEKFKLKANTKSALHLRSKG